MPENEESQVQDQTPESEITKRAMRRGERYLERAGFATGKIDGELDGRTKRGLAAFQEAMDIEPTGMFDEDTLETLARVNKRIKKRKKNKKKGKMAVLSRGTKSKTIKKVEQRLADLGYDVGEVDGIYDGDTEEAVKNFKRDEDIDNRSGSIGHKARSKLIQSNREYNHRSFRRRRKPSKQAKRARKAVSKALSQHGGKISAGDRAYAVRIIKRYLKAAGYDPRSGGPVFTERTAGALKAFQKANGRKPNGVLRRADWKILKGSIILSKTDGGKTRQSVGERSSAVKRTEKLLKELGFNPGKVDGVYTKGTQKAVNKFRKKYKIKGKGGVGDNLIKKMKKAKKRKEKKGKGGPLRQRIVNIAKSTLTSKTGHYYYSQPGALTTNPLAKAPLRSDCSQWVRAVYLRAGAGDPGTWTGDMAGRGYRTSSPKPGDLMLGSGHVELYVGGGRTIGHGTAPINYGSVSYWRGRGFWFHTYKFLNK